MFYLIFRKPLRARFCYDRGARNFNSRYLIGPRRWGTHGPRETCLSVKLGLRPVCKVKAHFSDRYVNQGELGHRQQAGASDQSTHKIKFYAKHFERAPETSRGALREN